MKIIKAFIVAVWITIFSKYYAKETSKNSDGKESKTDITFLYDMSDEALDPIFNRNVDKDPIKFADNRFNLLAFENIFTIDVDFKWTWIVIWISDRGAGDIFLAWKPKIHEYTKRIDYMTNQRSYNKITKTLTLDVPRNQVDIGALHEGSDMLYIKNIDNIYKGYLSIFQSQKDARVKPTSINMIFESKKHKGDKSKTWMFNKSGSKIYTTVRKAYCPFECKNNGKCIDGKCKCDSNQNFFGRTCLLQQEEIMLNQSKWQTNFQLYSYGFKFYYQRRSSIRLESNASTKPIKLQLEIEVSEQANLYLYIISSDSDEIIMEFPLIMQSYKNFYNTTHGLFLNVKKDWKGDSKKVLYTFEVYSNVTYFALRSYDHKPVTIHLRLFDPSDVLTIENWVVIITSVLLFFTTFFVLIMCLYLNRSNGLKNFFRLLCCCSYWMKYRNDDYPVEYHDEPKSEDWKNVLYQNQKELDNFFPKFTHAELSERNTSFLQHACSICLELFGDGDDEFLRQIDICQHIFHSQCLLNWLEVNHTCPNCNLQLERQECLNHHMHKSRLNSNFIKNFDNELNKKTQSEKPKHSNRKISKHGRSEPIEDTFGDFNSETREQDISMVGFIGLNNSMVSNTDESMIYTQKPVNLASVISNRHEAKLNNDRKDGNMENNMRSIEK